MKSAYLFCISCKVGVLAASSFNPFKPTKWQMGMADGQEAANALKVRFTTRKWPPAIGGMETYSLRMSTELAARCDFECIALAGRRNGRAPTFAALMGFAIKCALRMPFRRRVDVAFLGDMAVWPIGLAEMLFGRAERLILSAHGSDVSMAIRAGALPTIYRAYLRLGALLLPNARIVANSSYTAELAQLAGFRRVDVIPLGTDMRPAGEGERSGLLFVGRITRAKGLRFLVEMVLPLLRADVRLRVAGTVWEDGEQSLLEHPAVDYLGALSEEQLRCEYSRAEITLIPSQVAEGFGLVAIEAAACGSQVVASRAGGLMDVVLPPWGDLVDPHDPAAWAHAIDTRIAADPQTAARLRALAAKSIDEHFRWEATAERTLASFGSVNSDASLRPLKVGE